MADPTVEELRRELDEAFRDVIRAQGRETKARNRLDARLIADAEAEFASRGITPGKRVIGKHRWSHGPVEGIYKGFESPTYHWADPEPVVMDIKKAGSAHATRRVYGTDWRLAEGE
ncbi:MAG: hypothetical protein MUE98_00025 [Rhodobacteraceae bacterium]|jgi:hypothetical protein|nr:hypothetical protein [Paracoccaceae bacterium]